MNESWPRWILNLLMAVSLIEDAALEVERQMYCKPVGGGEGPVSPMGVFAAWALDVHNG